MTAPAARGTDRWASSLLALILAAAGAFRLTGLDGLAPFIDESSNLVLSVDYASWDAWSRLLHGKAFGFLLFKPIFLFAWDPLYAARAASALIGLVSVTLTYWLLLTQTTRKAALAGSAFLAFMPLVVFHDRLALFDAFMVATVTGALLLYLRSEGGEPLPLLTSGCLFGMAVLTKAYAGLAILLWFPVLRRREGARSRAVLIVGLGFLACLLVTALFLAVQFKEGMPGAQGALLSPQRFLAPDLTTGQRASLALKQLGESVGYFHGYNGWAFLPVVLLASLVPGSHRRLRLELFTTWFVSCVILSVVLRFLFSRYLLLTLPALALLVALAFDDCVETVRTGQRRAKSFGIPLAVFLLLAICGAGFVYRDALIAAQMPDRVLPARDAYQYLWGGPSGFGLREIAGELRRLDITDERKLICVTRGMGMGTHAAGTLPLLLRHAPIRFVHVWLQTEEDMQFVRNLPRGSRVVFFVDDPEFVNRQMLDQLKARAKLLAEVKGTTGRPDYQLFELSWNEN